MNDRQPPAWQEISPILDELFDLDPDAQQSYLRNLSAKDQALADRIEELLVSEEPDAGLRAHINPLMDQALEALEGKELPDDRIGSWQIQEEIGRGGMGRVFAAARADGQYQQTVALKVMGERLGDPLARRRFLNERQILARLAHPNVAQLIDGGVLEDGRPYFAMEMVRGAPILQFADEGRLDLAQRIDLLIQLCRGLEYAHRNLIIHRDVKPSNILVTKTSFARRPGEPEDELFMVKLLDFGIAKMIDPEGTSSSMQTVGGLRPMTFEYASPEQIRGDDVSISSDLFSLGLVAYQLIAGTPAFDVRSESLSSVARVAELDQPTRRASGRFRALSEGERKRVAELRSSTPTALSRVLQHDLDFVLDKCLRKKPEDRYESVIELRRDLERYLEGRPVRARRGSRTYRLLKFASRHRVIVTAAAAVSIAILVAVSGVLWQARATSKQRDRALAAEAKSNAINRFLLDDLLGAAAPENARGQDLSVSEALDQGAARVSRQFRDQPELEAEVLGTIGEIYLKLGRADEAEPHLRAALAAARRTDSANRQVALGLAERRSSQLNLARGDVREALVALRQARARLEEALGPDHLQTLMTDALIARAIAVEGDRDGAEEEQRRLVDRLESIHPEAWRERLQVMTDLATTLVAQRSAEEAEELAQRTLDLQYRYLGPDHPDLVSAMQRLADAKTRLKKPNEALSVLKEASTLELELKGPASPLVVDLAYSMMKVLRELHDSAAGLALSLETLERARRIEPDGGPLTARMLNSAGVFSGDLGQLDESASYYQRAAEVLRTTVGESNPSYLLALRNLVSVWEKRIVTDPEGARGGLRRALDQLLDTERRVAEGDLDATLLADIANDLTQRARDRTDEEAALAIAQRAVTKSDGQNWDALQSLALTLEGVGRLDEALAVHHRAIAASDVVNLLNEELFVKALYQRLGRDEEVEPFLRDILRLRRENRPADDFLIGISYLNLGQWAKEQGRAREAEAFFHQAIDQFAKTQPDHYWRTLSAKSELGGLLLDRSQLDEALPLVLDSFETMRLRPFIERGQQLDMARRAIRALEAVGRTREARALEARLREWVKLPVNQPWPDPRDSGG